MQEILKILLLQNPINKNNLKKPFREVDLQMELNGNGKFQDNPKISKLKSYPVITKLENDQFNNTFFIKGYDEVNPYLRKDSFNRGRLVNKFKEIDDTIALQNSLRSDSSLGYSNPSQIQNSIKLPKIEKNDSEKVDKINKKGSTNSKSRIFNKNTKKLTQKSKENSAILSDLKKLVEDTRIETDDFSMIQNGSSVSLLKMSRQSIQLQPLSCLKISKIARSKKYQNQDIHTKKLNKKETISQQNRSEFISLTIPQSDRLPYRTILQEQSTSSSSEDQYVKDSVPGPGYYSISHHCSFSKPQTSRRYTTKNFDFGTKQSRFKINTKIQDEDSLSQLKLQAYQEQQRKRQQRLISLNKKSKKHVPFNSKEQSQRQNPENSYTQRMISPVYYNPRYGIEQQLIKKIQKNFKGKFGTDEKRFKTIYRKQYNLGPGSYSIDFKNNQQDNNKLAHFFSSKRPRFQ